jgi:hypothetical protein
VINALFNFYRRGAEDADRRIAAILAAPPTAATDRYLMSSAVVRRFDRLTELLRSVMSNSQAARAAIAAHGAWARTDWVERHRALALMLIIAVLTHVAVTLLRGPRAGWFSWIIPALVAAFAVLVMIGSRPTQSPK